MSGAYTRSGIVAGGHTSDQVALRSAAIEDVRALLKDKPQSCFDLSAALGIPSSTIYGYLATLQDMGEVYQMDAFDDRGRKTWAIDNAAQQVATGRAQAEHSRRAWIVPARQVGMKRDPLIEALFGPAPGAAA
jgi:predicted ArsR family transcriptional regulator